MQNIGSTPRLGIHSIGEFSLVVPSLAEARAFYAAFGLIVDDDITRERLVLRTADGTAWGEIVEGARKHMRHITFHCYANDFDALRARVSWHDVDTGSAPQWAARHDGLWFMDPDGLWIEIRVGVKTTPDAVQRVAPAQPVDGLRAGLARSEMPRVYPDRLSHIMRLTPDVDRMVRFYVDVLGLRLSDHSEDKVAFLHGAHGSDHHLMAFGLSNAPALHHLSWDVPTFEHVGIGAMGMAARGYKEGWGVGRHVLGSNYFFYVQDPWGSFCEYSSGMDFIPSSVSWQALDHPLEDSSYLWGPEVPVALRANSELN
ncbi:VOC family protein [Paraburkholderia sediminicola]|uniref:VOC family protein n=1 Tax=Paraburkholderia sediminicola TaxID=458836 RepID=UPI0038B8AD4F